MSRILGIDPGNVESAYALIDADTMQPIEVAKVPNDVLHDMLPHLLLDRPDTVIEMVASYGMSVGETVFETCVWIGRFDERVLTVTGRRPARTKRLPVKLHHCHDSKAKDGNIIQALVDRFASGQRNRGKGTKDAPGWFYGFADDMWQAYALAVQHAETRELAVA